MFLSLAVFTSCNKNEFLDINTNPNSPTEGSITPNLILPLALHTTASYAGATYASTARWMGYWTRGGDYGPSTEEESYRITTGFGAGTWANWYNNLTDYNVMETKANAAGQKFYEGIAKTMKTFGFMYLVDSYNNVPYSQAFDLSGFVLPAYDKGEDIYKDLFAQLDAALALINAADGSDVGIATADIMFGGDATMWRKLINTQRLRLVLRLSETSVVNPATELAKVTSDGYLESGETASVNPGYGRSVNSLNTSQQNPFWDTYRADVAGVPFDRYNRANNYVFGLFRNNNDIRYEYFFLTASSPLSGVDYRGGNYGEITPNNGPTSNNQSGVAGPALAISPDQNQWLITSVESMFMQAEATQRGWISGDAQTAFRMAVIESFKWLEVDDAAQEAEDYLDAGTAIVDWDNSSNKILLIMTQKYLGLVGIANFEAWADYRRVGNLNYPNVPKSLAPSVASNIPLRYRYPQNEYNYNAANVAAEGDPNPLTSPIFWDK